MNIKMKKIKIASRLIEVEEGKNLLEALVENKIYIENPCRGKKTCGKCKIKINNENYRITSLDEKYLTQDQLQNGIRLACDKIVLEDLDLSPLEKEGDINILSSGYLPEFEIDKDKKGLGLAIDIGTTTIVMDLVDLESGKILKTKSFLNPQKTYGQDVLSRITYQVEKGQEAIKNLQEILVEEFNKNLDSLEEKNKITDIVVAANTTMAHTLLGIDARSLGSFPYKPAFVEMKKLKASQIGLNIDASLYTLPHVSAFIGSDIVAGVCVSQMKRDDKNILFIDIGTNGEIVLNNKGRLLACSCAAGPALEGMNISSGMRAEEGAIEDLKIQKDQILLETIGQKKPKGLCGSGILAAIRELIDHKMIKENGAIIKNLSDDDYRKKYIDEIGKKRQIIIEKNEGIILSQADIRNVQLAKGAILSGFLALLEKAGLKMEDLDQVLVAGQFGSHLPSSSLVGTGILPEEVFNKITYLGNTSKSGAYMALLSEKMKNEMEVLAKQISYLELALVENYEKIFRQALFYPVKEK